MSVALVTASAVDLDVDLAPLLGALMRLGVEATAERWDDTDVDWRCFALVILRSTWDYTLRYGAFIDWLDETERAALVLNPSTVVRWNTDKRYLRDLQRRGHPVVPTVFADSRPPSATELGRIGERLVVKPVVGAGARDAAQHSSPIEAQRHAARLLEEGRAAMVQPYIGGIDVAGETGLVYFDGVFSHSFRKAAMLRPDAAPSAHLYSDEEITPREAATDERAVADAVVADCARDLLYARVDAVRGPDGSPLVLELELAEPSFFVAVAPGSGDRFARAVARRLDGLGSAGR
jgi:glutathione synthase/RimK-type ligase-like ATP-grasp enzyme